MMRLRMCFIVVLTFERLADEYSGQVCEDESLDKSNQHLDQVNENGKRN